MLTVDDNEITMTARSIASSLSYNEDEPQVKAKHMLRELAFRLDQRNTKIVKHPITGRMLVRNGIGASRRISLKEKILYKVFGIVPPSV